MLHGFIVRVTNENPHRSLIIQANVSNEVIRKKITLIDHSQITWICRRNGGSRVIDGVVRNAGKQIAVDHVAHRTAAKIQSNRTEIAKGATSESDTLRRTQHDGGFGMVIGIIAIVLKHGVELIGLVIHMPVCIRH